jgi:histidyl-tRNA synthetase
MTQNLPLRLYYVGPMFRYERPQKGRYRQFHQIGVETLGVDSPMADVEVIALASEILRKLKIEDKCQLEINTIGDIESRQNYRDRLVAYLAPFKDQLSADSQQRLEKNPLRILDSKDEADKKILGGAPLFSDCLTPKALEFFASVRKGLSDLNISFVINERLVRGLDYYCHTVFEFTTTHLGSQSAVIAGGRYDSLVEQMGGPSTTGVGWASGIERLKLLLETSTYQKELPTIAVISGDESCVSKCSQIAMKLRQNGFRVEQPHSGNMGKKFKRADKIGAQWAVVIGTDELRDNLIAVKNLKSGEQVKVSDADLLAHLQK